MEAEAGRRRFLGSLPDRRGGGERGAVLLIAAHPDDEVVGAGALLATLRESATVIHVTEGAPRGGEDARRAGFGDPESYARARRAELLSALALAGIPPSRALRAGFPDQEASFHLAALSEKLADLISALRPRLVLTHPYEGGHPDHDAAAFSARAACRLLGTRAPALGEMTSYHAHRGALRPGRFLPARGFRARTTRLTPEERALKRRMMDCFVTQARTLAPFGVAEERFRPAPLYDFGRPPHPGRLYYEGFDWGLTGERWRALAREAREAMRA